MASSTRLKLDDTTPPAARGGGVPAPGHLFDRHRALLAASAAAPARRTRRFRRVRRLLLPAAAVLGAAALLAALAGLAGERPDGPADLRGELIPGGVEAAAEPPPPPRKID